MKTIGAILTSFLLLGIGMAPAPAVASEIRGRLEYVYDGDTIRVRGAKIRLNGLHAPEWNHPGGREATAFMKSRYGGKTLTCVLNGDRSHDRLIGTCWGPGGEDVAAALVAAGLGRDCPRYSGGRYASFETNGSKRFPLPGYCR